MNILVTGGNGFVGRPLVRALAAEHRVHVIDNLRFGAARFEASELGSFELHEADIRDRASVARIVAAARPDAIIHVAAIHYIPECEDDPGQAFETNVSGTVNLLLECPPTCRFVFASSAAVYRPSSEPLCDANSVREPYDIYGATKAHAEDYVTLLARKRGLGAVIVRLFNVVGPGETNPHVLPEIIAQLKAGRSTLKLGTTSHRRDFIHVQDAAAGFIAAATRGVVTARHAVTVDLGTGRAHSIDEVVELLRDISGREIVVERDPARIRPVDNPLLVCDNSRIRELFDWRPAYDFPAAVRDTWREPDLPAYLTERYQA